MKKFIIFLILLFYILYYPIYSIENDTYLLNIEKALHACHFDKNFPTSNYPTLREEVIELFLRIYENEKAHPDFIQCINAQDSFFYAYQVITKELYRKLHGQPREDFEFLRFPTQNLLKDREEFFSHYPALIISKEEIAQEFQTTPDDLDTVLKIYEMQDEAQYLNISNTKEELDVELDELDIELSIDLDDDSDNEDEEAPTRFLINDTHPEISKELISVNFTLETFRPLDSALFVFLTNKSVSLSSSCEDEENYKQKLAQILHELFNHFSFSQDKISTCIKELIEKAPRSKFGIINQILLPKKDVNKFVYLSFGGGFLHSIYDAKFEEIYQEFQSQRQEQSFRTFRNFQARIIAGGLFENPNVKIIRYTLIPPEVQREYEAIVRDIIDKLLTSSF